MANAVNRDASGGIIDGEQDPVIADSQPIPLDASQLLNLGMTWLSSELFNSMENSLTLWLWNVAKVLLDAPVVEKGVHA